jgi:Large polyvalent protein-associated domain 7
MEQRDSYRQLGYVLAHQAALYPASFAAKESPKIRITEKLNLNMPTNLENSSVRHPQSSTPIDPVHGRDLLGLGSEDEVSIAPARLTVQVSDEAEYAALLEKFNRNEKLSDDPHYLSIESNNYGLMGVSNDGLDMGTANTVVAEDLASLRKISNRSERHFASVMIGANANNQANYRHELTLQAPAIAAQASAAIDAFFTNPETGRRPPLGSGLSASLSGVPASPAGIDYQPVQDDQLCVMAPYWQNGLHNAEGIALAEKLNKLIKLQKLEKDKDAISRLLSIHSKAQELGIGIVSALQFANDNHLRANVAQPRSLLGGALVRDKDGAYRPAAGGAALLLDKGDAVVLKSKGAEAYRGAMELALAKGWTAIELQGKPAMLADAWLEAKLMNLDVVNYSPSEQDLAKFAARVAEESARKVQSQACLASAEQAPEMVEVRPFVDVNGQTKMATVTYTVSYIGGQDENFSDPKAAARAFGPLAQASSPVVIRSVTRADGVVSDAVVAGFDIRPSKGTGTRTLERMEDRVFDAAMEEMIEQANTMALLHPDRKLASQGSHVGPIVSIEGDVVAQKTGRDPNQIVWHSLQTMKGQAPKLGEMAEINYAHGVGVIKSNEQALEVTERGKGLAR